MTDQAIETTVVGEVMIRPVPVPGTGLRAGKGTPSKKIKALWRVHASTMSLKEFAAHTQQNRSLADAWYYNKRRKPRAKKAKLPPIPRRVDAPRPERKKR